MPSKIYLNSNVITHQDYTSAIRNKIRIESDEKASNGIHFQNLLVGICHSQEIDFEDLRGQEKPHLLLLSSPPLTFKEGKARNLADEEKITLITERYRTILYVTQDQHRNSIILSASEFNQWGGNPEIYFNALITVAKEYPNVNIFYHPTQFGNNFASALQAHAPRNVFLLEKEIDLVAKDMLNKGENVALHYSAYVDFDLCIKGKYNKGFLQHTNASFGPLPNNIDLVVMPVQPTDLLAKLHRSIQDLKDYSQSLIDVNSDAAGQSGLELASELLELTSLAMDVFLHRFEQRLSQGYNDMSNHRRLGYFHSFLILISSALSAIKAYIFGDDVNPPKMVTIGETSQGFFNLTTRQQIICTIKNEFDEVGKRRHLTLNKSF